MKSWRTIPSIVFQLPPGPAICRDIGGFADSARPTTTSPVDRYRSRSIDTDLPRSHRDIGSKQFSLASPVRVGQRPNDPAQAAHRAGYKNEAICTHEYEKSLARVTCKTGYVNVWLESKTPKRPRHILDL